MGDVERLIREVDSLVRRHQPAPSATLTDEIRLVVEETLLPSEYHAPGDLSAADVYRIRLNKFMARVLPPALYRDRILWLGVQREIRDIVSRFLEVPIPGPFGDGG